MLTAALMKHPFRRLRARLDLSQADFARRLGVTQSLVSQIETGRVVSVNATLAAFRLFRRDLVELGITEGSVLRWRRRDRAA